MRMIGAMLVACAALTAPAAFASASPDDVIAAFSKVTGAPSDLRVIRNDSAAIALEGHLGRLAVVVALTNCKDGKACESAVMQTKFALGRIAKPGDYEAVSIYNSSHPFTAAYVVVEGARAGLGISQGVVLTKDLKFSPEYVAVFGSLIDEYAKFAGERKGM